MGLNKGHGTVRAVPFPGGEWYGDRSWSYVHPKKILGVAYSLEMLQSGGAFLYNFNPSTKNGGAKYENSGG